jgi:hypothetical protein
MSAGVDTGALLDSLRRAAGQEPVRLVSGGELVPVELDLVREAADALAAEREARAAAERERDEARREIDEALCTAEGPSTLHGLVGWLHDRGQREHEATQRADAAERRAADLTTALRDYMLTTVEWDALWHCAKAAGMAHDARIATDALARRRVDGKNAAHRALEAIAAPPPRRGAGARRRGRDGGRRV